MCHDDCDDDDDDGDEDLHKPMVLRFRESVADGHGLAWVVVINRDDYSL